MDNTSHFFLDKQHRSRYTIARYNIGKKGNIIFFSKGVKTGILNMKTFLIRYPDDDVPYDEYQGFVVRAKNEKEARKLVCEEDQDINDLWSIRAKCIEINKNNFPKSQIILDAFNAG